MGFTALVILLLATAVGVYLWAGRDDGDGTDAEQISHPDTQRPAKPALYEVFDGALTSESGEQAMLVSMRGTPTLLLFWSSWCDDCKGFLQDGLDRTFAEARESGMRACLVCREGRNGETWESALECLRKLDIKEETMMDEGSRVYEDMGLQAVPSIAILDESGRLIAASTHVTDSEEIRAMIDLAATGAQAQSEAFLRDALMDASGAVCSAYRAEENQVVRGTNVLSETQGLMMLYAVKANDQTLFDRLFGYVRDEMTVSGLTRWRVTPGETANVNASLDDLRILEALLLAEETWGGYRSDLSYRESALYRLAVRDGYMCDYVEFDSWESSETVTLCYLDVAAMEELAAVYPKWELPASNARKILENGAISDAFPLSYPRFSLETGQYEGDRLQMNEALVTLYHMAKAGMDCGAALDWIETQMEQGAVYAVYTSNGDVEKGYEYESVATYALIVQTALICERDELARTALAKMEEKRCFSSPLAGDYGSVEDAEHYTFDLMHALLAWQAWNTRGEE